MTAIAAFALLAVAATFAVLLAIAMRRVNRGDTALDAALTALTNAVLGNATVPTR